MLNVVVFPHLKLRLTIYVFHTEKQLSNTKIPKPELKY